MNSAARPATAGGGTAAPAAGAPSVPVPCDKTLQNAARLAIEQDKPIMLDYYVDTVEGRAFIGEDTATKERILVRNEDEYTSVIQRIFKVATDFIIVTENSVYIVSGNIKKKNISSGEGGAM